MFGSGEVRNSAVLVVLVGREFAMERSGGAEVQRAMAAVEKRAKGILLRELTNELLLWG
jgi:hypothetical protein